MLKSVLIVFLFFYSTKILDMEYPVMDPEYPIVHLSVIILILNQ
jgi:hypothetical protein